MNNGLYPVKSITDVSKTQYIGVEGLIKDPFFNAHYWRPMNSQVSYGNNGVNGKASLDFVCDGVNNSARYYDPMYGYYIPVCGGEDYAFTIRLKALQGIGGSNQLFSVVMRYYDKDKNYLTNDRYKMRDAISTVSHMRAGSVGFNPILGNTFDHREIVYVTPTLTTYNNATSGIVSVDYFQLQFNTRPTHYVMNRMSTGDASNARPWTHGQGGYTSGPGSFHFIKNQTYENFTEGNDRIIEIPGSTAFPYQLKAVLLHIDTLSDSVELDWFTPVDYLGIPRFSNPYYEPDGSPRYLAILCPISYFSSVNGTAYLRFDFELYNGTTARFKIIGFWI